jgi:methionine-rich copper-binding protein CopC
MRARRAMITLLAAGAVATAAVPALAHTDLLSSGPAKGSVVKQMPKTVVLNFGEPLQAVEGADVLLGTTDYAKSAKLNPRNARQVRIATRNDKVGRYTVKVKVVTADGHRQQVSYSFRVKR